MNLTILFGDEKKELQINNDSKKSLLEILIDNNISIESDCGGIGKCDKCKVRVRELSREYRACELKICNLSARINEACETEVEGDLKESATIEIPGNRFSSDMKIEGADKSITDGVSIKEPSDCCEGAMIKGREVALAIDIGTTTIVFALAPSLLMIFISKPSSKSSGLVLVAISLKNDISSSFIFGISTTPNGFK